jgi:hypothetical protein
MQNHFSGRYTPAFEKKFKKSIRFKKVEAFDQKSSTLLQSRGFKSQRV